MALAIRGAGCLHDTVVINVGAIQHTGETRTARSFSDARVTSATRAGNAVPPRVASCTIATIKCASTKLGAHIIGALERGTAIAVRFASRTNASTVGTTV